MKTWCGRPGCPKPGAWGIDYITCENHRLMCRFCEKPAFAFGVKTPTGKVQVCENHMREEGEEKLGEEKLFEQRDLFGIVIDRFYQGKKPTTGNYLPLIGYENLEVGQARDFTGETVIIRVS